MTAEGAIVEKCHPLYQKTIKEVNKQATTFLFSGPSRMRQLEPSATHADTDPKNSQIRNAAQEIPD